MIRILLAAALLAGATDIADAQAILRVGDQKGNSQAVMQAAGVLKDLSQRVSDVVRGFRV